MFVESPTEQTTAATDLIIALVASAGILYLKRFYLVDATKVRIWSWMLGLLAAGALLGAVVHGLEVSELVWNILWQPLFLILGLVVALFVAAALHDSMGKEPARRAVPLLLAAAILFYSTTLLFRGTFLVFVVYEGLAMLFAFAVYSALFVRRRLEGAGTVAFAILLNIVAAGVQATESVSLLLLWPFDHNGVFHLIQIVALLVLFRGLGRGLSSRAAGRTEV